MSRENKSEERREKRERMREKERETDAQVQLATSQPDTKQAVTVRHTE